MASTQNSTGRMLRRYGPFAVILVVILAIVLVTVVVGGDDDDSDSASNDEVPSQEELTRSGPMTPEKADLLGRDDVDFGPNCDTELGTVAIPTVYAPPCVEPFEGDNGGATSKGVTEDSIKIVRYAADPALDPLLASQISGAGADVDPESANVTAQGYIDMYAEYLETYGREIDFETYTGTGASDDEQAAKTDAQAIAAKKPFAVVGGPSQATRVFADELAAEGILCMGNCALAIPENFSSERRPYIWNAGPTPNEAALLAAEAIGKLAPPGPAEYAGDPELQQQERVYAIAHYDTPDGSQEQTFEQQKDALAEYGIDIETDAEFFLDLARAQENARTIISKFKDAGVTTIIYTGDPITPSSLTQEATAQEYFPEWILGQSVLADTAVFGRLNDEQWKNGFGISLPAGRAEQETANSFRLYQWFTGEEPPNNTYAVINPEISYVMRCIHLAGPNLTPETCRDGMYRIPPSGGGPTNPQTSWGDHGFWPGRVDIGATDDATIVWWDPTAEGENEIGQSGLGLYRYANGGQRYKLGDFPDKEASGLYDVANSVTIYDEVPPDDVTPDYPSPAGG